MLLWRRNRHEAWSSIATVLVGFHAFRMHMPLGPVDTIGLPIVALFARLLAFDAALDWRRWGPAMLLVVVAWAVVISRTLPPVLYHGFTTRHWASR